MSEWPWPNATPVANTATLSKDEPCLDQNRGRRRIFWTTKVAACGTYTLCGAECGIPGLEYEDVPEADIGRTIKNDEYLRSLILNILNTRARTELPCPSPAAVYGHWSEVVPR